MNALPYARSRRALANAGPVSAPRARAQTVEALLEPLEATLEPFLAAFAAPLGPRTALLVLAGLPPLLDPLVAALEAFVTPLEAPFAARVNALPDPLARPLPFLGGGGRRLPGRFRGRNGKGQGKEGGQERGEGEFHGVWFSVEAGRTKGNRPRKRGFRWKLQPPGGGSFHRNPRDARIPALRRPGDPRGRDNPGT